VANAILYDLVANVAAIPGSPSNNDAVEVVDSTGIESFTPLAGKPVGFTGSSGLSVRIVYTTTGATWNWIQYFPNDPETRYFKVSGGSLNGQLRADDSNSVTSPVYAFDGDTDTGIAHTGANELVLVTGGSARLTIDGSGNVNVGGALTKGGNNVVTIGDTGTVTSAMLVDGTISDGDISGTAAISLSKLATGALPTTITVASANIIDGSIVNADISATAAISASKIQAASTSNAGVVQLTDSTSSTSTTTAGTPNAIKSAYDLANAAVPKSLVDAKGDLLVATANDTVSRLAVGSNNQVLTADSTTGTGLKWATPASGSWRFISSVTASNSASVAFTSGINSTYDIYVIAFSGVESTSGQTDLNLRFSTNGGSSYFSGASDYTVRLARNVTAIIAGTGQTAIKITDQVRVTTDNFPVSGFVYLLNASVSGKHTAALIYSAELDSPANNHGVGRSLNMGTGVVDAVQFSPSTGNMNGIFRLYGISNS
jgi:L-ascorbate metabolism protein UlaG (beta-lactamase superfamily)